MERAEKEVAARMHLEITVEVLGEQFKVVEIEKAALVEDVTALLSEVSGSRESLNRMGLNGGIATVKRGRPASYLEQDFLSYGAEEASLCCLAVGLQGQEGQQRGGHLRGPGQGGRDRQGGAGTEGPRDRGTGTLKSRLLLLSPPTLNHRVHPTRHLPLAGPPCSGID